MKQLAIVFTLLISVTQLTAQFVEEKKITEGESSYDNQLMSITVTDKVTQKPVAVNLRIDGLNTRKAVVLPAVTDTIFPIKNYRRYTITCAPEGYMFFSKKFWPKEQAVHEEGIALNPLAIGLKADVPGIQFLGDKTEIYYKSKSSLDELIQFLNVNPTVKIAVVGHVNAPDPDRSDRFYVKASLERSEAVVKYLIENGVDEARLMSEGKGNKEMVYPDPVTDWQNDANRRVEIRILSL